MVLDDMEVGDLIRYRINPRLIHNQKGIVCLLIRVDPTDEHSFPKGSRRITFIDAEDNTAYNTWLNSSDEIEILSRFEDVE